MLQMISIPDPSIVHTLLIVISPLNVVEIIVSHHFRKRYKYGTICRNAPDRLRWPISTYYLTICTYLRAFCAFRAEKSVKGEARVTEYTSRCIL